MSDEEHEVIDDPNRDPEYQAAFLAVSEKLAIAVRDHMKNPPYDRDRVFQVLNALASQSANILVACNDPLAVQFFLDCLESNVDHIRAQHPEIANPSVSG